MVQMNITDEKIASVMSVTLTHTSTNTDWKSNYQTMLKGTTWELV